MTIKNKTLLWLLVPHILIAIIAITFYYFHAKETLKQNIFDKLEIAANESREHTGEISRKESRVEYYTKSLSNHLVTNKKTLGPKFRPEG